MVLKSNANNSDNNVDKKFELITRNLQEVTGQDKLKSVLSKRNLKIYWGTAPTGKPHVGYLVPFSKMADFLDAGCEVKILFANLHAFLDSQKTPFELLDLRTQYYEEVIKATMKAMNVDITKLTFVKGMDYQLSKEYSLDAYRLTSITTINEGKHAGAEVVKQSDNPRLAPILYPLLQALDEQYLDVDAQFGGLDQRKIFMYAEEYLPKLGYEKRIHFMNPLVPGLTGGKMSASEINSKIDLIDSEDAIKKKMNGAYCPEASLENNGVILLVKYVIMPYLIRSKKEFVVDRPEKFGGNLAFSNYDDLEKMFLDKKLHPMDLKNAVAKYVIEILKPVREHFNNSKMQDLVKKAYGE